MEISQLITYPIKSTAGVWHQTQQMTKLGLLYDRSWAIFDNDGQVMTAREYPLLLDIKCSIKDNHLVISHSEMEVSRVNLLDDHYTPHDLNIFNYKAHGKKVGHAEINDWISTLLGQTTRLMVVDQSRQRPVLSKHGGATGDIVGFSDQAPILIISQASMDDLNNRLESPMSMDRFRPNIVINGCNAYEEDKWDVIRINGCRLKIIQQCERCVFTTIDPITKSKHPKAEPLRTLATYRKGPKGGVVFGAHAVPLDIGVINVGDVVRVEVG